MATWKVPGPHGVHGYCINACHLQIGITRGEVPDWMTTGQTVLILKDKSKGNEVSNYRPLTCYHLCGNMEL